MIIRPSEPMFGRRGHTNSGGCTTSKPDGPAAAPPGPPTGIAIAPGGPIGCCPGGPGTGTSPLGPDGPGAAN